MRFDCNVMFGKWRYEGPDTSIEKVRELLSGHMIDRALAISARGMFYDDIEGNDETALACSGENGLYPVGTINLGKFTGVEEEVAKRKKQGFAAFRLFNDAQDIDYGGLVFKRFAGILEKYEMPLILKGTDKRLKPYVGRIAKGLADTGVKCIILDVSGYSLTEIIGSAKFNKNLYFGTRLFNTLDSMELFCEDIGPERLVLATGIPFYYGNQSIYRIQKAAIDDMSRELIFSKNLINLLELSL